MIMHSFTYSLIVIFPLINILNIMLTFSIYLISLGLSVSSIGITNTLKKVEKKDLKTPNNL